MPRFASLTLSLGLCLVASRVLAQGALVELYGEGVHRYFAGDTAGALELMTRVIEGNADDPRAYYFRGLAQELQGGSGQPDFEAGALLEAEANSPFDVGLALTRIQGHVRAKIEQARRNARVTAVQQALQTDRTQLKANQAMPAPAGQTPAALPPAEPAEADLPDPFSGDGKRSDVTTVDPVQPTAPEVDATTDPFGDDPAAAATPAAPATTAPTADPFGTGGAPAANDPFGSPAPAASPAADPFGTPAPAATPPAADPFGTPAPAGADPFGTPAPAATPPAADPFGTPAPASTPADADPFGGAPSTPAGNVPLDDPFAN